MLKVSTAKEMQHIDRVTIEKYGIAGAILMERAGLAVVKRINETFFESSLIPGAREDAVAVTWKGKGVPLTVIVVCGSGNNGGDGFVIARVLHNQGKRVEVFLSARPEKLSGDAKINYDAAKKFGVKINPVKKFLSSRFSNAIIVDALLGTGLSKEVRAPLSDVINKINKMSSPVVSVDIPSGISSDTGQVMGSAVQAQYTVTFGLPKRGHFLYPGAAYTGKLYIQDIGFPRILLESEKIRVDLPQKNDMTSLLPVRPEYSHKGTYGHVLLVAGSRGKTGAALMAARACLKAGAGLVTIGIPETLVSAFQTRVTEEMILPLPDKGEGTVSLDAVAEILGFLNKRGNVLAIGPGLSVNKDISQMVEDLIRESHVPVVIDADGINAIAGRTGILKKCRAPVILTPHVGEMARLLKRGRETGDQVSGVTEGFSLRNEIEKDRINTAMSFSKKTKTHIVLKGVPTVIATPEGLTTINSTGNPGMATAGTGDVLTGMISAFLAQGLPPRNASILGVYMHGHVGDVVAEKKGQHSLVASDMINAIPQVFKSVKSNCVI